MSEAKPTQWDETPCEHCGESEGRHYVGRCHSVHSHKFYTPVGDSSLSYRQLVERVKELEKAAADFMEAQAALDNREGMGINAEPYEVLMHRRNVAWDDLEAALSKARKQGGA